ncbi:MAG: GTPase HflX [Palaeococcus sp.]|uniref:GTPase HflX n=1 Tax=Palaeococcus sp. (in: euryarchaeotes) TaxID=2820298 RepID=UPI0025E852D9|nr:GTPase HflX [Palaeococcus sp. (in: euryarchaeotes)]MCD6559885.1 GTPase HflX [Palaeococcus sp. (in: euryarchaeotes)]
MKVVGVIRHSQRKRINREEFKELLTSAGYEVLEIVEQVREESPRYNIGRGKLEEIKNLVEELKPEKVIFANRLTPSQAYNLSKELKVDVMDKWQLVLEIFGKRAHSKEAKLQVELANLEYEMPLVKEAIRRIKLGDRAGFKGMGEYQTQQYLKHIRYRMGRIRKELERVKEDRAVKRKRREEVGFILLALAGYTNAGKSTLLNVLAGEELETRDQMFTTLSTTTRNFKVKGKKVLITDTVGFIDNLPPFIVEAFHSTLEEIIQADIILLVLDVSEPWSEIKRKFLASIHVLRELKALDKPLIVVLNKKDLTSKEDVEDKRKEILKLSGERGIALEGVASISAMEGDLEELFKVLNEVILNLPKFRVFSIVVEDSETVPKVLSLLREIGEIIDVKYGEKTRIIAYIQMGMIKELTKLGIEIRAN